MSMTSSEHENGWTVATGRSKRKPFRSFRPCGPNMRLTPTSYRLNAVGIGLSTSEIIDQTVGSVMRYVEEIEDHPFGKEFNRKLREISKSRKIERLICLGVGSPSGSHSSKKQTALALFALRVMERLERSSRPAGGKHPVEQENLKKHDGLTLGSACWRTLSSCPSGKDNVVRSDRPSCRSLFSDPVLTATDAALLRRLGFDLILTGKDSSAYNLKASDMDQAWNHMKGSFTDDSTNKNKLICGYEVPNSRETRCTAPCWDTEENNNNCLTTLFFMPHCDKFLYSRVLRVNDTAKVVIFGNNFHIAYGTGRPTVSLRDDTAAQDTEFMEFVMQSCSIYPMTIQFVRNDTAFSDLAFITISKTY